MRPANYAFGGLQGFFVSINKEKVLLLVCYARQRKGGKTMNKLQEFYAYQYKEAKSGLTPEEKKRRNEVVYALAMQRRKKDPKAHALGLIGVTYEDIRTYRNSKDVDMKELRLRVTNFVARIKELASVYGLTGNDVRDYFARNNYSLVF